MGQNQSNTVEEENTKQQQKHNKAISNQITIPEELRNAVKRQRHSKILQNRVSMPQLDVRASIGKLSLTELLSLDKKQYDMAASGSIKSGLLMNLVNEDDSQEVLWDINCN